VENVKGSKVTRSERAALTRARMLDAAYALFCEIGFRASTMTAIAERAGVAVQTLYFTFHTKDELIQAVHDRTVLGDESLPPPMQPWYRAAVAAADVTEAVAEIVAGIGMILARVAPMVPAFHEVAADPAGEVWRHAQDLRRSGMADLVGELSQKATRTKGLSKGHADDLMYVYLGPELYRTLVLECGWSIADWSRWVERAILRDLFDIRT
jgi:AcrR family transcriptional regulator